MLCAGIFSCSKEVEIPSILPDNLRLSKRYLISLDSVRRIATELPARFGANLGTRTSLSKQVLTVTPLNRIVQKTQTRSGNQDILAPIDYVYVVDYADQEGFAVISADTRLDRVLAYSDKGNFEEASAIPSVGGLISNIPDYVKLQLAEWDSLIDPNPPGYEYSIDHSEIIHTQTSTKGPFITTKWGQWEPFSKYTGGPLYGPTIAMIQLMAYYNWPLSISASGGIILLDWPLDRGYVFGPILEMYPESVERIAKVADKVRSDLINYDKSEEVLYTNDVKMVFPNYGYVVDNDQYYSLAAIKTDLDKERPVIMTGFGSYTVVYGVNDANGWIVDGYQYVTVTYQNFRVWYNGLGVELRREDRGTSIETRQLLHCNWGWDGRGDGYFTTGLFAPQQAQSYDFPTLGTTDNHNYRFVVTQCTNTRPQHYPQ